MTPLESLSLFRDPEPSASQMPEGFRYNPDVISDADERAPVQGLQNLPLQPFEFQGFYANRRIFTFGHKYIFAGQKPRADARIPDYLRPLAECAAAISGKPAAAFAQVMVTEYKPGAGIGWHVDRPSYEEIVSVSFLAPCTLRLRRKVGKTWERRSAQIEPRSVYLLSGPARTSWQHSIPPQGALRYSVTLRTFRPEKRIRDDAGHKT